VRFPRRRFLHPAAGAAALYRRARGLRPRINIGLMPWVISLQHTWSAEAQRWRGIFRAGMLGSLFMLGASAWVGEVAGQELSSEINSNPVAAASAILGAFGRFDDFSVLRAGDSLLAMVKTSSASPLPPTVALALAVYADRVKILGEPLTAEDAITFAEGAAHPGERATVRVLRAVLRSEEVLSSFQKKVVEHADGGKFLRDDGLRRLVAEAKEKIDTAASVIRAAKSDRAIAPIVRRALVNQSIVEAFGLPPKQGIAYFDRILQGLSSAGPSNVLAKLRVTRYAAEFEELSGMEDKAFQRLEAAAKQLGPMENCMEGKEL
jgi:hypothetical protein